jgi:hypothetical protein
MTVDRTSAVAVRFIPTEHGDLEEEDTFIEVETGDGEHVDLHIGPRTDDVVTCSLSPGEAWRLCRELARVAAETER